MDIWFWVNDWWSWVFLYCAGWLVNCRFALASGWQQKNDGSLYWKDNINGDFKLIAFVGSWVWPVILPILLAVRSTKNGASSLFIGRPPKHMRQKVKEAETKRELERINEILKSEGIEV